MRLACIALVALLDIPAARGEIVLAGEPVRFDDNLTPQFSARQLRYTAVATRAGLARWAATEHGRQIVRELAKKEYDVIVREDLSAESAGSAPQPGIATLAFRSDHSRVKSYLVILNPEFFTLPRGMRPFPNETTTIADLMATAWAAEMLHIYFYVQGVSLPHHRRSDFQEAWQAIAAELGFPSMRHDDDDEAPPRHRSVRLGRAYPH